MAKVVHFITIKENWTKMLAKQAQTAILRTATGGRQGIPVRQCGRYLLSPALWPGADIWEPIFENRSHNKSGSPSLHRPHSNVA